MHPFLDHAFGYHVFAVHRNLKVAPEIGSGRHLYLYVGLHLLQHLLGLLPFGREKMGLVQDQHDFGIVEAAFAKHAVEVVVLLIVADEQVFVRADRLPIEEKQGS